MERSTMKKLIFVAVLAFSAMALAGCPGAPDTDDGGTTADAGDMADAG
jgi:hypothetical protein